MNPDAPSAVHVGLKATRGLHLQACKLPIVVELCLEDPGHEVDLVVNAELLALTRIWMGEQSLRDAQRAGLLVLQGPPSLVRAFPGWLKFSLYAHDAAAKRPQASTGTS